MKRKLSSAAENAEEEEDGDSAADSSTGPGKPKQKIMRTLIACNACKEKHDRCDGGEPVCGNCKKRGSQCYYDRSRQAPGPQRGWLNSLKNRITSLESLLVERTRAAVASGVDHGIAHGAPHVRARSGSSEVQSKKEKEKLRTVLDEALTRLELLISDLGQQTPLVTNAPNQTALEHSATSDDSDARYGQAQTSDPSILDLLNHTDLFRVLQAGGDTETAPVTPSFEDLVAAFQSNQPVARIDNASQWDSHSIMMMTRPIGLFDDSEPLPPPELINELVMHYFKHTWEYRFIYAGHPMVHRPT
ncbi:hypothetical protein HDU93_008815 [Gonapodya sp. JEL0774]|nr:hypothetical protein HDU93_008815 [Gonapodya sp. JEL0774]